MAKVPVTITLEDCDKFIVRYHRTNNEDAMNTWLDIRLEVMQRIQKESVKRPKKSKVVNSG